MFMRTGSGLLVALGLTVAMAAAQAPLELPQPSPNAAARSSLTPEVEAGREVLYFADQAAGGGPATIHFARQPLGLVGAWGPRTPIAALNIGSDRREPAVLPDNQGLVVAIAGGPAAASFRLYLSHGDAGSPETATWTTPQALQTVAGPAGANDSGASILRNPGNTTLGDLFFASDRGGAFEVYWAPHLGAAGFSTTSWGAPSSLGLRARVPGATAVSSPSVALRADGGVEMVFSATVGGVTALWKTSNPGSTAFTLGNPAAWTTPTPIALGGPAGSAGGAYLDAAAGLLYFQRTVGGVERLFVSRTQSDLPLLLANDIVAAGENSQFVLIGPPNAYFALVSDLVAVNIPAPPYGQLGVLYPPSPQAFVFDGTGVFPGANYLPLPLVTDAVGLYLGNLGPIPVSLVGTTFHTQAFLYDPVLGDWRLSDDGDPTNGSPASATTITGGGALVQLRSVGLLDADYRDAALGVGPRLEASTTFHDLDDPWASFSCRVPGQVPLQARVAYDFLDANGAALTMPMNSPPFSLPGDAQDHDYAFPLPAAVYQAACPPGASYAIRAQLELESSPGVWSPYGLHVAGAFRVTANRPVVLVHGLGGGEESFGELARILEEEIASPVPVRRFLYSASVTNTLPGQGAFDSKAAELALFMADTGYLDYTIVAHSIGGLVARRFLAPGNAPAPSGDVRLAMFGTPNFGARATLLFEPAYTAPATTAIIQAFLPPLAPILREELTPGSAFLLDLAEDWGAVAPSIPVLNFVGHAGLDFGLILGILGLPVPAEILADPATNDGLIHIDEAVLPAAQPMPSGSANPINAFVADSHNPDLAGIHGIFFGASSSLARFEAFDLATGRPSLVMLRDFHQASAPLGIANPLAAPPPAAATGSLLIPTTFAGAPVDDFGTSDGVCYRNQQTDCLLWTGLPLVPAGSMEHLWAPPSLPLGSPGVGTVVAGSGLVRILETRIAAPLAFPGAGAALTLQPSPFWPY